MSPKHERHALAGPMKLSLALIAKDGKGAMSHDPTDARRRNSRPWIKLLTSTKGMNDPGLPRADLARENSLDNDRNFHSWAEPS